MSELDSRDGREGRIFFCSLVSRRYHMKNNLFDPFFRDIDETVGV